MGHQAPRARLAREAGERCVDPDKSPSLLYLLKGSSLDQHKPCKAANESSVEPAVLISRQMEDLIITCPTVFV